MTETTCRGGHWPISEYGAVCPSCLIDEADVPPATPFCTCPPGAGVEDCVGCPEHGAEAESYIYELHGAEVAAEYGWLRAAENSMEPCPWWAQ